MRTLLLALSTGVAAAQSPLEFTIDTPASQWHWSGNTDIGPLVGNPSQDFALADTFHLLILSGALPIDQGQFVSGGAASVVPDLHGKIPNPVPNWPPLAEVDVEDLTLQFTTDMFSVAANGDFNSIVTVTALSGTLTVTPLVGSSSTTDLTGTTGDPTAFSGTITQSGSTFTVQSPQVSSFTFSDPGSGITGTIDLMGDLVGHHSCAVNYCEGPTNGNEGDLTIDTCFVNGGPGNTLTLSNSPSALFGYPMIAASQGSVFPPGASGELCVGPGNIGRYNKDLKATGGSGGYSVDIYNSVTGGGGGGIPSSAGGGALMAGDTWNFQCWNRIAGSSTFSSALTVTFM